MSPQLSVLFALLFAAPFIPQAFAQQSPLPSEFCYEARCYPSLAQAEADMRASTGVYGPLWRLNKVNRTGVRTTGKSRDVRRAGRRGCMLCSAKGVKAGRMAGALRDYSRGIMVALRHHDCGDGHRRTGEGALTPSSARAVDLPVKMVLALIGVGDISGRDGSEVRRN